MTGYNVTWYNGENFHTVITTDMLITRSGKKITKKSKPYINIGAGFDCETSQFADHNLYEKKSKEYKNALKSFVYIWQFSVGNDIYLCRDFSLLEDFLNDLDTACNTHANATLIVWDANINYEYSYFKPIFRDRITACFARSKSDILTFSYGSHLEFRECIGVFGSSLDDIAKKHTTTQKLTGDIDYNLIRTPKTPLTTTEIHYCINDVAILSELTAHAHSEYTLKHKKIPLTQTGIVRSEISDAYAPFHMREKIYETTRKLIGTQTEYNTFRKYVYSGGLTHSNYFYVGKITHNIKCKDLTSAYPWALNAFSYPAGELVHATPDEYKKAFTHKHYFFLATLRNVKSKSTHSTLSMHKSIKMVNPIIDNGRIHQCKILQMWFTEIDWNNFKLIYDFDKENSEINDVYYFTSSSRIPQKILDVMNKWYERKTILKPLTDKATHGHDADFKENVKEYKRLKSLINSVYGMFVTALYDTEIKWNDEIKDLSELSNEWDDARKTLFNPWWGYYCTAHVRARLIECIAKFPDDILQYDTDSIYHKENAELETFIEDINKRVRRNNVRVLSSSYCYDLGEWDNDGFFVDFVALGSKRYIGRYENGDIKITFAGANEDDIKTNAKKANMDVMKYAMNINIDETISNKTGAYHFDGVYTAPVTDYKGVTTDCTTYGCTTIKTVQFKAQMSHNFKYLKQLYLSTHKGVNA